jgi:hypothetical protein
MHKKVKKTIDEDLIYQEEETSFGLPKKVKKTIDEDLIQLE